MEELHAESHNSKQCGRCYAVKPISQFSLNCRSLDGREWICLPCKREYRKDYLSRTEYPAATEKRVAKAEFYFAHPEWTLKECAEALGIKSASLSRAVAVEDPDTSRRIARRQAAAEMKAEREMAEKLANAIPCLVCGQLVLRGKNQRFKTCSYKCAELWRKGRLQLSGEEHHKQRLAQARSILRSPEKYRDVQVKWAQRMLSTVPPPPNRRYEYEGSVSATAAHEARKVMRENLPEPRTQADFIDWLEVSA